MVNYNLPRYSGLQLFKSLSADKALSAITFIMLVPKMNKSELADLDKQGVKRILQRPFTEDQLKETVFSALGIEAQDMKKIAKELAEKGKKYFEAGDCEKAVNLFRDAADADRNADYYYMQGRCYLNMELVDQAIAAFQNAMSADRAHPHVDHWLGVALQRKKEYTASVKALERATGKQTATADTHVELGKSCLGADLMDKADRAFDKAMSISPDDVNIRADIGEAYLEKGVYDKAESAFGSAIDIKPENIHLYNRMAIALRKQGKHADAINLYVKALNIAPEDEGLYYNLARALSESGKKDKAIKALDKALKLDPEFEEAITLRKTYLASSSAKEA